MVDFAAALKRGKRPDPPVPALTIGLSGHRPDKLWSERQVVGEVVLSHDGYEWGNPLRVRLRAEVRAATERLVREAERRRYDAGYRDSYLKRVAWQNGYGDGEPGAEKWRSVEVFCLHGGALGADQDAAGEWRRMGLPYIVVQPFPQQDQRWPAEARETYRKVLAAASGVYTVSAHHRPLNVDRKPQQSAADARTLLLLRNEVLLCMSDELIAVYDGSSGGTSHAVNWWSRVHCGSHLTTLDPRDWR